jgi:hypothetical protein
VRLPGGVEAVARAAGLTGPVDRSLLLVELVRRLHGTPAGTADAAAAALRERVGAAMRAAPGDSADTVPLRLSTAFWAQAVFAGKLAEDDVVRAILVGERRAALFYHGVAALDPQTAAWLAADPAGATRLFERHAEAFAAFGRSVHVDGGRMRVPGGEGAADVWQTILGAPVTEPAAFIDQLFDRDGGRRAWLYDVIAHLPAPVQRHVLGAHLASLDARVERLRVLADVFARVTPSWRVAERPLWRPLADPAVWLSELQVRPDGLLAGPLSGPFVDAVFASVASSEDRSLAAEAAASAEALDAASLAARVFLADQVRARERLALTLFAQRVFGATSPAQMADALTVCAAFPQAPALVLSLERMGITRPDVLAAIVRQADGVTRRGAPATLAAFEGALALVEGVRLSRAVDRDTATRLVGELAALPWPEPRVHASLARWLRDGFLPALGAVDAPNRANAEAASAGAEAAARAPVEWRVLDALAGLPTRVAASAHPGAIVWEGQRYVIDARAAERARLERVRAAQGGSGLDVAIGVVLAASALVTPDRAGVESAVAALDRAASGLGSPVAAAARTDGHFARPLDRAVVEARDTLRAARESQDFRGVPRLAYTLAPAATRLLADELVALAYAASLPGGAAAPETAGLAARHDFGAGAKTADARLRTPWTLAEPVSGPGEPWRLRGSLLGLDLGLAARRLRRLSDEPPTPTLHGADRDAIIATTPLLNPFDVSDASRDRLVAAIARGAARIDAIARDPERGRAAARAAGLSEWREEALAWRVAHDAAGAANQFSLVEQVWLSEPDPAQLAELDAWGVALAGVTGQLATRLPRARAWEESAGHWGGGLLAGQMADLNLRIAQQLAALSLPAELVRGLLLVAVQDLIDRAQLSSPDDWPALVAFVRELSRARFEDFVAALTVEGPLRPAPDEEQP